MSARIVFFGNERLATGVSTEAPILRALLAAGYDVRLLVTQHETQASRKPRPLEIAVVAEDNGVPILLPDRMADIRADLEEADAEIGVLVAFGKIVPQWVIDLFPRGIVNLHPSALPRHRGPTPLESVMLAGETETAVSLMALSAEMDAGPIYAQKPVALTGNETKQELADQLVHLGRDLILKHLPAILDGSLQPVQQSGEPTYDSLITRDAGVINWQQPAAVLERQIRAYAGWPRSRTQIADRDVVITKAHVANGDEALIVNSLAIDELIPAGKKAMSGADFKRGFMK